MGKATGRKRMAPITLAGDKVHDRTAASFDLPANARTSTRVVKDPKDDGWISVTVSLRDDPLMRMWSIKAIDEAQFQAGRRWQRDFEASEIGGAKAMDPTNEPVDGGGAFPESLTDARLRATKAILDADAVLGHEGKSLIRAVLGCGMSLKDAADERGLTSDRDRRYIAHRFREALETLAQFYNLTGKGGSRSSTIRAWSRPLYMCTA